MNLKKTFKKAASRIKHNFDYGKIAKSSSFRKIGRFVSGKGTGKNLRKFFTGQKRHEGITSWQPTSAATYGYQYQPRSIASLMGGV